MRYHWFEVYLPYYYILLLSQYKSPNQLCLFHIPCLSPTLVLFIQGNPGPVCRALWNLLHYSHHWDHSPFCSFIVLNPVLHTVFFPIFCELYPKKIRQHLREQIKLYPMSIFCLHYNLMKNNHVIFLKIYFKHKMKC